MDYPKLMNILNAANYLLEHFAGLLLLHPFLTDDVVEKLASLHVLHHKKEMPGSFDYLK